MAQNAQYLSFNSKISPDLAPPQAPSLTPEQLAEMKSKDPALRSTWTLWEQIAAANYADATRQVASFSTVKGFWKYWCHLPQPSELLDGKKFVREGADSRSVVDSLMLFKEGIKPEWEDKVNAKGGHFQFQLRGAIGGGQIDEYWNNIVLGMVGGTIEPADMINGVRLLDKLGQRGTASVRIEVWFANFDDNDKVNLLEQNLTKCMTNGLDGRISSPSAWGKTERKSHAPQKK